ncbi:UNVERIFIED_CONTAM: hypothetical protein GTU68_063494 [Idotea baltica]|nr:hypothetical protein [Idotea baltica]
MIIPALDLIEGQVVRLFQGDYGQVTEYKVDPAEQFNLYHQAGAGWLHLVDLTGAKDTTARQLDLIAKLLASTPANIQIGGGVRNEQDVVDLLEAGAQRVVVGSTAVKQPELVKGWMEKYGAEKIVLALDINIDESGTRKVAISGWQEDSGVTIEALIEDYLTVGLKHVLCTDISRDGVRNGYDIEQLNMVRSVCNVPLIASGGAGAMEHFAEAYKKTNVDGALAASVFHKQVINIGELKQYLKQQDVEVRL